MLEMISNGISLDLPDDIQINFVIENPLMSSERIPVPYTLDFDLPPTTKNLKVFNYPNRVTSFKKKEFPVTIFFGGVLLTSGILKLKKFEVNLKVNYKGVSLFDDLTKKLYDVEMEKCEFGIATQVKEGKGKWGINRNDPNNFAYKYRKFHNEANDNTKFVLAPIRTNEQEWSKIQKKLKLQFIGASVVFNIDLFLPPNTADRTYINFYNFRDFEFNITNNFNITQLPDFYSSPYYNTRAFPFPYLGYIFDVCFKNTLTENPFSTGELSKLILVCPYHPNYKPINGLFEDDEFEGMIFDNSKNQSGSFAPYYKLNSFMPDMGINDFLREVLKLFCLSLYPDGDKFKIVKNEDIFNNQKSENWTALKIGDLAFETKEGLAYKFGYSEIDDIPVSVPAENVINSIKDLIDIEVPAGSNYIADYKIQSTGEYYTKEKIENGANYTRLNTGYGKSPETSKETFDSESLIAPLPMAIHEYFIEKSPQPNQVPNVGKCYVPQFDGDRMNRQTSAKIMFYRGYANGFMAGRKYPLLTAHNYDHFGNRVGDYSLGWGGDDGLINKFHKNFKEWVERDKMHASGQFRLTPMGFKMLDLTIRKNIDGRRFFVERLQLTITKNTMQPAIVDLLED